MLYKSYHILCGVIPAKVCGKCCKEPLGALPTNAHKVTTKCPRCKKWCYLLFVPRGVKADFKEITQQEADLYWKKIYKKDKEYCKKLYSKNKIRTVITVPIKVKIKLKQIKLQ